jgi:hypothetical protein
MITFVTPSTIASVAASASNSSLAQFLALVVTATFLVLLIETELVDEALSPGARFLARGVSIGMLPLGLAFTVITAAALLQVG